MTFCAGAQTLVPATTTLDQFSHYNPGTYRIIVSGDTTDFAMDTVATPPAPIPVLLTLVTTQTLPTVKANDGHGGIEVGIKFRSTIAGYIKGIRFYKQSNNTGVHSAQLYKGSSLLAQATFTNETATGWQTVSFTNPIAIQANTTYLAAFFSPTGAYTFTTGMLTTALVNTSLSAPANGGADGINGLYDYTNSPKVPLSGYKGSFYWVDVIFSTTK